MNEIDLKNIVKKIQNAQAEFQTVEVKHRQLKDYLILYPVFQIRMMAVLLCSGCMKMKALQ